MNTTQTQGQQFTAMVRTNLHINARTRNSRDGGDMKRDILEAISNAVQYPGYYSEERTALYSAAYPVFMSWIKHYEGYRIDGVLRWKLSEYTPYQFTALLGDMIDAGIQTVGDGEEFFRAMSRSLNAAA